MFKKLFFSIVCLAGSGMLSQAQTPTLTSFYLSGDSCSFNPTTTIYNLHANVSSSNGSPNSSVTYYWGDGTSSAATTNQNYHYATHTYASPGTYTVAAVLLENGVPVDTLMETAKSFCSTVLGQLYKRADANCFRDPLTEPIVNLPVQIQVLKSGVPVDTISVTNGYFYHSIESADLTSVFSLVPIGSNPTATLACPTNGYDFKFDTLSYNNQLGFQFGYDCNVSTAFDLSVTGQGFFRPVANSYINLAPRNTSCSGNAATLTLNLSPKYSFVSATTAPTTISGNILTWNISNLSNTDLPYINITLDPVGILTLGDTVMNLVTITPTTGDVNPGNNTFQIIDSIRASFDPNEKHVSPMTTVEPGQKLTYTVNFENLGNDTAFNIHILDTLSSFVDPSTFKVVTSSHTSNARIINNGTNSVLKVEFPNILLADASHPKTNKGFVTYEINAKSTIPLNTIIENTASIYFDINPAVVTNTTKNKYAQGTGIKNRGTSNVLKVYPNPAKESLFIEGLDHFKEVNILNLIGQMIQTESVKKGATSVSIAQLPTGIYFIQAKGKDGIYRQKFVKE
ncbi:MAG TPA: T9SS type A sorting domain-containing protein [Edaphocola sp.]|nr:T9SS type A sorting domain-containing protein [Edaphocola sp.]